MYRPHFIYPFIYWWTFELFALFGCYRNAALSICIQVFVCICILSFLGCVSKRGIGGPDVVTLCLTGWGAARLFSKVAASLYIPPVVYEGSNSSICLPTIVMICLFDYRCPSACEVVAHCVVIGISLTTKDVEHFFHVLIGHLNIFFGEKSVQILSPF